MADSFEAIRMQVDDVKALRLAMAKINIGEVADDFGLDAAERQALYELSDALDLT